MCLPYRIYNIKVQTKNLKPKKKRSNGLKLFNTAKMKISNIRIFEE